MLPVSFSSCFSETLSFFILCRSCGPIYLTRFTECTWVSSTELAKHFTSFIQCLQYSRPKMQVLLLLPFTKEKSQVLKKDDLSNGTKLTGDRRWPSIQVYVGLKSVTPALNYCSPLLIFFIHSFLSPFQLLYFSLSLQLQVTSPRLSLFLHPYFFSVLLSPDNSNTILQPRS